MERASGYVDSLRQVMGGRAAVTQDARNASSATAGGQPFTTLADVKAAAVEGWPGPHSRAHGRALWDPLPETRRAALGAALRRAAGGGC